MCSTLPLEICVDCHDGLAAAVAGGADRIELCSALSEGGLTPGPGLIRAAADCPHPCHAMIRPRGGDFVLRPGEQTGMIEDIAAIRATGLAGVVFGLLHPDGRLDLDALSTLVEASGDLHVTLHRAFDLVRDPFEALDHAVDLGVRRILTSGQSVTARDGVPLLQRLVSYADGRIEIMAGGGITPDCVCDLVATGVDALHASCGVPDPVQHQTHPLGIAQRRVTSVSAVAALKSKMVSARQAHSAPSQYIAERVC